MFKCQSMNTEFKSEEFYLINSSPKAILDISKILACLFYSGSSKSLCTLYLMKYYVYILNF